MENENMNTENGRRLFSPMLLFLVLVFVFIVVGAFFLYRMQKSDSFFRDTKLNGYDVSGKRLEEARSTLEEAANANVFLLEGGEIAFSAKLAELGYLVDGQELTRHLETVMEGQSTDLFTMLKNLLNESKIEIDIPYQVDEALFKSKVVPSALKRERFPSEDAYLKYVKKKKNFKLVPEVYGNEIVEEDLWNLVQTGIEEHMRGEYPDRDCVIEIPDSLYIQPKVKSDDAALQRELQAYNSYCNASITYTFGSQTEVIDWDRILSWMVIQEDGNVHFNQEAIAAYLQELGLKYDTRHLDRYFQTTYGGQIYIPGGDNEYGYTIDEASELLQVLSDLELNEPIVREPIYYYSNAYGNPYYYQRNGVDDLCGNYVECSLSDQHLWLYINYGCVLESDFVSGDVAKKHQTKTGCFPIAYKESPSTLVGDNANEEDNYRTKVGYWMPFYEGQGLHDATWRESFGGDIYLTNGSHGCINLPEWAAASIYSYVQAGMAVVIY